MADPIPPCPGDVVEQEIISARAILDSIRILKPDVLMDMRDNSLEMLAYAGMRALDRAEDALRTLQFSPQPD